MTPLDPRDKATICLAGYIALRTQMLQRNTLLYQVFTMAGTMLLAIAALVLTRSILIGVSLGAILVLILLFTLRLNKSDRLATAKRLEELRLRINRLANEDLLKPETVRTESVMDYLPSLRRLWSRRASA